MSKLPIGTWDQIAGAHDIDEEQIDIPEWGISVVLRVPTLQSMLDIQAVAKANGVGENPSDAISTILTMMVAIVDPPTSYAQADILRGKSAAATNRIMSWVSQHTSEGGEAAKEAVKTFRKGSGPEKVPAGSS